MTKFNSKVQYLVDVILKRKIDRPQAKSISRKELEFALYLNFGNDDISVDMINSICSLTNGRYISKHGNSRIKFV